MESIIREISGNIPKTKHSKECSSPLTYKSETKKLCKTPIAEDERVDKEVTLSLN